MPEKLRPITVIGASAGTGKTYRLALDFNKELNAGKTDRCPTQIIATTFTNRAAEELRQRIRKFLLKDSKWAQAQALYASHIGTVNSVCGRLVSDLSIESGLSPSVKIISEERQKEVFATAVDEAMSKYAAEFASLIYRLGKDKDWRDNILKIADVARQNDITSDDLKSFSKTSWITLKALLPAEKHTPDFDAKLKIELQKALSGLPAPGDTTKTTADVVATLREISSTWNAMHYTPWTQVVKLSKLKPAKASVAMINELTELAAEHISTKTFHTDLEKFIEMSFSCAADCLEVYKKFKAERALLDFIDQEHLALSLLRTPDIIATLEGRFSALFIDEFQDTSPIQLAVFLEIAKIVDQSIWVGDEKQSIFGFRGSDPLLMQRVVQALIPETGGSRDNLIKSYRSRPELVDFVNKVFSASLQPLGMKLKDIEICEVARSEDLEMPGALHLWWLSGKNESLAVDSLANSVLEILSNPAQWPVELPLTTTKRPMRGSDIAMLCRSNKCRLDIAQALSKLGILVSTERAGLLETPECVLAVAVLRFLADKYDTLAMGEIVRYTDLSDDRQKWLFDWLDQGKEHILSSHPSLIQLEQIRHSLLGLSPVESLQIATTAPCVLESILRWGNPRQRLLNLDSLVGMGDLYEETCLTNRQTASIAGLVEYLASDKHDALQPANPDEQAVQVLTYHKAKGLEWPMVIMYDLDSPPPATPFDIPMPVQNADFDPYNPLAQRGIHYWPWPYSTQKANIELSNIAQNSPEMISAQKQHREENLRLLYVGMTRPRDYLVLACRETKGGADWLNLAVDQDGESVFTLSPGESGLRSVVRNSPSIMVECKAASAPLEPIKLWNESSHSRYEPEIPSNPQQHELAYSCAPSSLYVSAQTPEGSIKVKKKISLGTRLNFTAQINMRVLGDALHLFLAEDDIVAKREERLQRAREIATAYEVSGFPAEQFLEANSRLHSALEELYPDAVWLREWPVTGRLGDQRTSGSIDLLLELSEGYVVVDHKCFPGSMDSWEQQALGHYPQLDAYARLVSQSTNKNVISTYIHMPIIGALLEIQPVGDWKSEQLPQEIAENWLIL